MRVFKPTLSQVRIVIKDATLKIARHLSLSKRLISKIRKWMSFFRNILIQSQIDMFSRAIIMRVSGVIKEVKKLHSSRA